MQVTPHGRVRSSREPTADVHQCNEQLTKPAVLQRKGRSSSHKLTVGARSLGESFTPSQTLQN